MGLVFYDLESWEGLQGLRLRSSAVFMSCCVVVTMPFISMLALASDHGHVLREGAAGLYSWLPLYLSKVAATTPLHALSAAVYALITYVGALLLASTLPHLQHRLGLPEGDGRLAVGPPKLSSCPACCLPREFTGWWC